MRDAAQGASLMTGDCWRTKRWLRRVASNVSAYSNVIRIRGEIGTTRMRFPHRCRLRGAGIRTGGRQTSIRLRQRHCRPNFVTNGPRNWRRRDEHTDSRNLSGSRSRRIHLHRSRRSRGSRGRRGWNGLRPTGMSSGISDRSRRGSDSTQTMRPPKCRTTRGWRQSRRMVRVGSSC